MSLRSKSDENINLVGYAVSKQKYQNVAASRAYYSVFQRIKHFLVETDFDYDGFLERNNYKGERPFSHRTIKLAYVERWKGATLKLNELNTLNLLDDLRHKRIKADYSEASVEPRDVERCMGNAKNIIEFIENRESEVKVD